jgi:hypothetical protein
MRTLFLLLSGPLAIAIFGGLLLMGNPVWLAALLALSLYGGFLYSELKEFV